MGVVFRARDPKINRLVAIKSIRLTHYPPDAQEEFRQRFLREAEAAGRLSHPGIVTIFDVGEELETRDPYLVMEYVRGKSLDAVLGEKGRVEPKVALQWVIELAEALDCAHGQNVIHRDLKPANILLSEDGHPKIADFGVAKLNFENLTLHGQVLGTPAFMSPEQLNGYPVDGRSDLFSLGVILYMLLTGHRPFQGNSPMTVSFKVVNQEPVPAAVLNLDLPAGLDRVLSRAMAKDRLRRYGRGAEMALDLKEILAAPEQRSNPEQAKATPAPDETTSSTPDTNGASAAQLSTFGRTLGSLVSLETRERKLWAVLAGLVFVGALLLALERRSPSLSSDERPPSPSPVSVAPAVVAGAATASSGSSVPLRQIPAPITSSGSPVPLRQVSSPITSAAPMPAAVVSVLVESPFQQASVALWVDDHVLFQRKLQPSQKKRFGLFRRGSSPDSQTLKLTAGAHAIRIRVQSHNPDYDESHTVAGDFPTGSERVLRVAFGRHNQMTVTLR
jgi:serine/threonine-protein kinase